MQVGVDIGGTFTDLVLNDNGQLKIHKLLSSPHNPAESMLKGLDIITPGGIPALTQVAHGSTVATNAILERKGAKTALITTQGFRDVLFIGRQNRPVLYALHPTVPQPLIPREHCYEVPERLDYKGKVLTALDTHALDTVLDQIEKENVDSIAVCFLFSYVNSQHEQAVKQRILERGMVSDEWQIVLSSDVLPEFREYERTSTIALEAYVRPIMSRYITQLENELPTNASLRIMKSDGGVMRANRVREQAINTALSGPAAGVMGAYYVSKLARYDQIITLDMGGTSTDVSLIAGKPEPRPESEIDNLPLRIRMLDIETIGAGGGSIARVDAGGALRVGPESAGANPGPVVYGRGGQSITVSDANTILGRLDPDHFLGGTMSLDMNAGHQAMQQLAQQINFNEIDTAKGVIDIANVNIDRAVRRVSIARGYDPREFTLVAFGGAGPLHACEVAQQLDIPRVLIPYTPGVLCALGLLVADVAVEYSRSVMRLATRSTIAKLRAEQIELIAQGKYDLEQEGIAEADMVFNITLDLRYEGQAYELNVPFGRNIIRAFHETHELTYGHAMQDRRIEIINMRLNGSGIIDKPTFNAVLAQPFEAKPFGEKPSPLGGMMKLYNRDNLHAGAVFEGEALVFQLDSTTYIPSGWLARVDGYKNLILEKP